MCFAGCTPHFASYILAFIYQLSSGFEVAEGKATPLTSQNFDGLIAEHQLVFINFYTDWCRFSQILGPVFDDAAAKIVEEFPAPGRVLFGKIDCDEQAGLAARFQVSKYPTLKLIQNGKVMKREYRGQRSADALVKHIQSQLTDPITYVSQPQDWEKIETDSPGVVAQFDSSSNASYLLVQKVAMELRDDCKFYVHFKDPDTEPKGTTVVFKEARAKLGERDQMYEGSLENMDELSAWALHRCIPLIREITFDNAEELTEEGLPFLILFHHPDDKRSLDLFSDIVHNQLLSVKDTITFLTADGVKFSHPLHHLGKTQRDLPLIAIDSFRHMYLYPKFEDITKPGELKQFINDLYSGKLHREFHYGPDPTDNNVEIPTMPPESTFRKLGPSKNRYTLLKEEL